RLPGLVDGRAAGRRGPGRREPGRPDDGAGLRCIRHGVRDRPGAARPYSKPRTRPESAVAGAACAGAAGLATSIDSTQEHKLMNLRSLLRTLMLGSALLVLAVPGTASTSRALPSMSVRNKDRRFMSLCSCVESIDVARPAAPAQAAPATADSGRVRGFE